MDRPSSRSGSRLLATMSEAHRNRVGALWHLLAPPTSEGQEAARLLHDHATPCVIIPASEENAPELFVGDDHLVGIESIRAFIKLSEQR